MSDKRPPRVLEPDPLRDTGRLPADTIVVDGIEIAWDRPRGVCTFRGIPVALMWVDSTLAGLMAGAAAMVGPERFALALQAEGRKGVESDWRLITRMPTFREGFAELNRNAAVAGWGDWRIVHLDEDKRECRFVVQNNWEGLYQKALGVSWGSALLAGKLAGICSKLFGTNCWATQTAFVAKGAPRDEFVVQPSPRVLEDEIEHLLLSDRATRADMAVALERLRVSERALRASEARLASIIDAAHDAIVTSDEERKIVIFNPAAEWVFGCSAQEALGTSIERFVPADGGVDPLGDMPAEQRIAGRRADGTTFPADAHAIVSHAVGQRLQTVVLRDATEQIRLAAERAALDEQLRHAQRMDAIGTLAGGIAHDFNNFMTVALMNLDVAEAALDNRERAAAGLANVRAACRQATNLVRQILTFSRKQNEPFAGPVVLSPIVREAVRLLRASFPANVELVTHEGDKLPPVVLNPTELQQVIVNLCTNAWHALGGRAGTITVTLDAAECDEETAGRYTDLHMGKYALLRVSDTGSGMSAATLSHLFEPFFTTKPKGEGTGLGLSVVHGIVKRLGGAVLVDSHVGVGTTFRVYLPAAGMPHDAAVDSSPPPSLPRAHGERVLFVDDKPPIVAVCLRVLSDAGYDVIATCDAEHALEQLEEHGDRLSLVVTDLDMPGRSGFDVARAAARSHPELPVVLASGLVTQEVRDQASSLGVREVITKPYGMLELIEVAYRNRRPVAASESPPLSPSPPS